IAAYTREAETNADYAVDLRLITSDASSTKAKIDQAHTLPIRALVSKDKQRFRLLFSKTDQSIFERLDELPRLSDALRGHTGIRARSGQSNIVSEYNRGEAWRKGLVSGSSVSRHGISW